MQSVDQMSIVAERDDRDNKPSASNMDQAYHCPGSVQAQRGLPELPLEAVTSDGLDIHESMETGDDSDLGMTQKQIADRLRSMEAREVDNWRVQNNIQVEVRSEREGGEYKRYWIRTHDMERMASARPDVVYLGDSQAFCLNYKTGYKKPTPSELSWQSRTEVIAVWHHFFKFTRYNCSVRGAFLSSRLSSHFSATDYELKDLVKAEEEIAHIVWRSAQPDAPRVPGPWCRYCRAAGVCRENAVYAMIEQSRLPVAKSPDTLLVAQAVARMTPAEMGFVFKRKSTITAVFDAVEAKLKLLPPEQLQQAGYVMAPGNQNKEITDPVLAFSRLGVLLTNEERMQCIKLVRGKASEILADRTKMSKKEAAEKIDAVLGDTLRDKPGNPKLKAI